MAGGQWNVQNKVRPGVYINFNAKRKPMNSVGERGIVAFPASLPWGVTDRVIELDSSSFGEKAVEVLGFKAADARIRHIAAAMSHASSVLLYRLGGTNAAKAKATEGALTATAKWGGLRGNDLRIVIQADVDESSKFNVITLLDLEEVDRQTVAQIEELENSAFIDWTGTGAVTASAGVALAGGTEGTQSGSDFTTALAKFESYDFNVLGISLDDAASKQVATAYVKRQREEEGKKIVAVMANYPEADYEGVMSLHNGIVTSDGLEVSPTSLVWEVAAMQAAANINEALTYTAIPNAVGAFPRLTHTETIAALNNGELVVTALNGRAVIEQDINTLTSFSLDRSKAFSKNRVVRVLDAIGNDIKRLFDTYYIGKISNNSNGRALLQAEVTSYLKKLEGLGAIQNFDSQKDIVLSAGEATDAVQIQLNVQPVDSVEKIYMNVEVV
ncbi:phage tail sheath family protein [Paenibacillus sp. IITD108]|uniref:phage tail sheath family protein n=1 Tax=Paenibacillus sp. IITD108 TaxID=3116649 RepID=UPI002F3F303A